MNLINTYCPEIIFGSESWLNSDISSSEIFPTGYNVCCKDRPMVMVVFLWHVTSPSSPLL